MRRRRRRRRRRGRRIRVRRRGGRRRRSYDPCKIRVQTTQRQGRSYPDMKLLQSSLFLKLLANDLSK
jgi:hypothetical protein